MTTRNRTIPAIVAAVVAGALAMTLAGADKAAKKAKPAPPARKPTRWVNAVGGDSAVYKVTGWGKVHHSWRIQGGNNKEFVSIGLKLMSGGKFIWGPEQTIRKPRYVDPNKPTPWSAREEKDLGIEAVMVKGLMLRCKVTRIKMTVGQKTFTKKIWTNKRVPGHLVREMSDAMGKMQVMQELVSFNRR